ncbi:hypothetical protein ABKN59_006807 [Abortiporus biennis]
MASPQTYSHVAGSESLLNLPDQSVLSPPCAPNHPLNHKFRLCTNSWTRYRCTVPLSGIAPLCLAPPKSIAFSSYEQNSPASSTQSFTANSGGPSNSNKYRYLERIIDNFQRPTNTLSFLEIYVDSHRDADIPSNAMGILSYQEKYLSLLQSSKSSTTNRSSLIFVFFSPNVPTGFEHSASSDPHYTEQNQSKL